jgi:hypothetical protein
LPGVEPRPLIGLFELAIFPSFHSKKGEVWGEFFMLSPSFPNNSEGLTTLICFEVSTPAPLAMSLYSPSKLNLSEDKNSFLFPSISSISRLILTPETVLSLASNGIAMASRLSPTA